VADQPRQHHHREGQDGRDRDQALQGVGTPPASDLRGQRATDAALEIRAW